VRYLLWSLILLCLALPAHAQRKVAVVKPDGTTQLYIPAKPRRVVVTVHDTVTRIVHDTVERVLVMSERVVDRPVVLEPVVFSYRDTVRLQAPPDMKRSAFGIFGYADFRGSCVAPALSIDLDRIDIWLYAGSYYTSVNHIMTGTAGVSAFAPLFSW